MIPRIRTTASPRFGELPPFGRLKHEARRLSFVVDPQQLADGEAARVLLAYAASGAIDLYATAPAAGARLLDLPEIPDGYSPIHPLDDVLSASWKDDAEIGDFAVSGISHRLRWAAEQARSQECVESEARRATLLIATAEQLHGCDGLVSDDPIVRGVAMPRSAVYTSDEAAALVGLHARTDGDFSLGPDMGPFGRFYFYWVLARELLPAGWRWLSACHQSSRREGGDPALFDIAGSAIQRLDSALRARDRFHAEAKRPHTGRRGDDALFFFETTMLYLSAAFDGVARVAGRVYQPEGSLNPSWRSSEWLKRLANRDPSLSAVMRPESRARDALEAVQILRNTIHGEALQGVDDQRGGERRHVIHVPPSELEELLAVVERLGGRTRWGVEEHGTAYVDPQIYIETAIADAAPALNLLMASTDVSRLAGVDLATLRGALSNAPSAVPPSWSNFDPFAFENRRRVRALSGFGEIPTEEPPLSP